MLISAAMTVQLDQVFEDGITENQSIISYSFTNYSVNSSSLNFWENWDGVMRELNGSPRNPVQVNPVVIVVDIVCCVIGLPLNFYMAAMILCKKRLRRKAKNILQLAPALCDIFTPICI